MLHCDASKFSYSGILQQTRPGTDKLAPVAYFSGNFDKMQVKWNIMEKKLTLSTSPSRGLDSISQVHKLQSLVIISHSKTSLREE